MNPREIRTAIPAILARPIYMKLLAAAFVFGAAYKALQLAVDDKVSIAVFTRHVTNEDSLKMAILQKLEALGDKVDAGSREQKQLRSFLCQDRPRDIGCQR